MSGIVYCNFILLPWLVDTFAKMNLKEIHIGKLIHKRVEEREIPIKRIVKFLNCYEEDIQEMYKQNSVDTFLLLRWSKLLEYDFFRIYTGHLILYAPPVKASELSTDKNNLPVFRKNIYTEEVKTFLLEKISTKQMSPQEVVFKYKIPKTTLYKWLKKV